MIAALADHVWQSTLCLFVAALLTLALRRNHAQVRYAVWAAASLKFLIPFAPLVAFGRQFSWRQLETVDQPVVAFVNTMSRPFSGPLPATPGPAAATGTWDIASTLPAVFVAVWLAGCVAVLTAWALSWRRLAKAAAGGSRLEQGDEIDTLRRLEQRAGVRTRIALVRSEAAIEPGVFGWWRPMLLWPRGISGHLTSAQIEVLIAHEVCHVKRRDNLVAALHMLVEAIFWFHPLVWWLETRLVDERERACDEQVMSWGYEPVVYAESILRTCELYVASPIVCVAGITGSGLKSRIEAIMNGHAAHIVRGWRVVLLASAAAAAIGGPIVIGALTRTVLRAQTPASALPAFEAASVKVNQSGGYPWRLDPEPGGRLVAVNVPGAALVRFAYNLPDFQLFGTPDWLRSTRFDVTATAGVNAPVEQQRLRLRRLLADRFKLVAHTETRELPVYAMVPSRNDGKLGPRMRQTQADCAQADQPSFDSGIRFDPNGTPTCGYFGFAPGSDFPAGRVSHAFRGVTMPALAKILVPIVSRSVIDRTGLKGYFDAEFDLMAELPPPPPPPGAGGNPFTEPFQSIFTVFPEQLGLKLEATRGPVDVLVIDQISPPTPD